MWVAMGNAEHAMYVPVYGPVNEVSAPYQVMGNQYRPDSAYWTIRQVSALSEINRDLYGTYVREYFDREERQMIQDQKDIDQKIIQAGKQSPEAALDYATKISLAYQDKAYKEAQVIGAELNTYFFDMSGDDAQRKLEKGKPYIPSLLGEERAKEIYEERGINQGGASQPLEKPGETGSTIKGHWAEAIIRETKGLGLVEDIEQFQPNQAISRAEFAYFLVTALDLKAGDKTPSFIDVTEATPHKEAILRAASLGIIKGRGQGIFAPNDQITRQEAMVMVQRALKLSEGGGSLKAEEIQDILGKFADGQGVSDWAKEAVAYTVQEGLIKGRLDGLIPLGKITRAEGLQIMVRLEDR